MHRRIRVNYWLLAIQAIIGFEWFISAQSKFRQTGFMSSIEQTLEVFGQNTVLPWYSNFLSTTAADNAHLVGQIVRVSELLAALALLGGAGLVWFLHRTPRWLAYVMLAATTGGALLNVNYYLASGWSSPSASGLNIVMGLIQVVLMAYYTGLLQKTSSYDDELAKA